MFWLNAFALCALVASVWWFFWAMRRADAACGEERRALRGAIREHHRAVNLDLARLCELLGYDTEKTGLEDDR